MKIYTKKGDDGTTGLLYGGRVAKDSIRIELNGAVDEAQAALGMARSHLERGSQLDSILVVLERDLWVLMAEVATSESSRGKLKEGKSLVSLEMVSSLEETIDNVQALFEMPKEFVVPGENKVSASLDVARTVIRRAERLSVSLVAQMPDSRVGMYLNRLSDLVWTLARWQENHHLLAKEVDSGSSAKVAD